MKLNRIAAFAVLACAGITAAHASQVSIAGADFGVWQTFDVSDLLASDGGLGWTDIADGSSLSFTFSVPTGFLARLTVVDGGFAGDRFSVSANGNLLGTSSAAVNNYPSSLGLDFDAALASSNYSHAIFSLGAGTYTVSGALSLSALDDFGNPLNSTVGGLKVDVSAVPLPAALPLLLSGLGLFGLGGIRRRVA